MTSPVGSKGASPLKIGGLALIAAGAVAASIGVAGLSSGPTTTTAAAPTTAAPTLSTGILPASRTPQAAPPTPQAAAPPAAPAAAPPAPPNGAAPGPAPSGPGATATPVRVYNNSKISGLAERAAEDFRRAGWTVADVANYSSSNLPVSTVYYQPGPAEQASAEQIGAKFGLHAEPRPAGVPNDGPGLVVIVTKDYQQH